MIIIIPYFVLKCPWHTIPLIFKFMRSRFAHLAEDLPEKNKQKSFLREFEFVQENFCFFFSFSLSHITPISFLSRLGVCEF